MTKLHAATEKPATEPAAVRNLKTAWKSYAIVGAVLAGGLLFHSQLVNLASRLVFGEEAKAARADHSKILILYDKYDHLHEEIRDTREDMRVMQQGILLQPLPVETPWPEPSPPE